MQCASRRACPINIQQQQWCWSYAAGWCLCRHAQNSQTVHSVPSATGSCAEDGDLVAGAIGGARHRTDQWIEPGMRVHYTGSFCARPVKRTAIRDLDQTVSSCPGSSCHICKKERTTQNVNLGPASWWTAARLPPRSSRRSTLTAEADGVRRRGRPTAVTDGACRCTTTSHPGYPNPGVQVHHIRGAGSPCARSCRSRMAETAPDPGV